MKTKGLALFTALILTSSILIGCAGQKTADKKDSSGAPALATTSSEKKDLGKLVVSYAGGTCEAPIYVAYHNGFFKDEGLDVELIQADFEQLKTGVASGKIDASIGNFSWFKPIEQGLKVKLTGGVHAGCIQAVAPPNSGITKVADLKGKTIGVEAIGGGPMITLSIELKKLGIDPKTDVQWKAYPPPQLV